MDYLINVFESFSGVAIVVVFLVILLLINSWFFKRVKSQTEAIKTVRRSVSFLIVFVGILVFVLMLPIDKNLKGQILSFLAIITSAAIALSSTTILGNLIAGVMNNSMNRFRNGDLIKVGDLTGRVTKKSVFHIEIQLEDSNFVTIPNLYIVSNPIKLTRKSNTVISSTVSLGYEIPRIKVEKALKSAALLAGLTDPYVYITELGDYSISYKIHGFLDNSDSFFSKQSMLKAFMLDSLHKNNIEIVSPSFMNQRKVDQQVFIPKINVSVDSKQEIENPEELIFDKAIKSEKIENKKDYLNEIEDKIETLKTEKSNAKNKKQIEGIATLIEGLEETKGEIKKNIEEQNLKLDDENK